MSVGVAFADDRVAFMIERLRAAEDYRVRTQAALNLGGTDDDRAVNALCDALNSDANEIVRQASASALKRLNRKAAIPCLRRRLSSETSDSVKLQIGRAIDALDGAPGAVAGARYYISIGPITNNTDRPRSEIERLIQDQIRETLAGARVYQIAPANETPSAATGIVSKNNLKGWYLSVTVDRFEYSTRGLRAQLHMAVATYPGKDIKGSLDNAATYPGAQPGDTPSQDALLKKLAEALTQQLTRESKFQ